MTSLPYGYKIVDFLGHMDCPPTLKREILGLEFNSPLVLSPTVDPEGRALKAFSRFGFGAMVVGPVAEHSESPRFQLDERGILGTGGPTLSLEQARSLEYDTGNSVRLLMEVMSFDENFAQLPADGFILSPQSQEFDYSSARELTEKPIFLGCSFTDDIREKARQAKDSKMGLYISGKTVAEGWLWGDSHEQALKAIAEIRDDHPTLELIVDGGSLCPQEAIELHQAGAQQILLGPGLAHTGPGLPKRINEALASATTQRSISLNEPPERLSWFWAFLLGLAMLIGSVLAGWISLTEVVLPYDEEFCGKTASEIANFNPRIISFMTHDRFTLAGTMVSLGVLYIMLSLKEIRRGSHWAQRTVVVSGLGGFFTFFAFLGFGYFDPLHALVTAILFQLMVQVMVRPLGSTYQNYATPCLENDLVWRRAQWGRLLFIVQAVALMLAGGLILSFGMTTVFVPQDINYLATDSAAIEAFDPQLKALIAHDRATFGGMLVSAGLALLLTTMWGFRRGDAWLWWTYLVVIVTPYLMTLAIHYHIGYWDHVHLAPVYIGLALWAVASALSGPFLLKPTASEMP